MLSRSGWEEERGAALSQHALAHHRIAVHHFHAVQSREGMKGTDKEWFRPDPLCCTQHVQHKLNQTSSLEMAALPDVPLEPIIERTSLSESKSSLQDCPYLQVGLVYMPHGSSEDMLPADKSSAVAEICGEEKHWLHTDITLEELKATMLAKAKDYFHQNIEAAIYQMLWRSKHETAYIQVKKANMEKSGARRTFEDLGKQHLYNYGIRSWSVEHI
ncbi:hypothetical protein EJB05_54715, partial [Eragrostis curvula]